MREREAAWRDAAAPVLRELGIDIDDVPAAVWPRTVLRTRPPTSSRTQAAGRQLSLRPAVARTAAARPRDGVRRCFRRRRPSTKRAGSKRMASMRSSRRVSRPAGIAGMFLSDDLTTQVGTFALMPQIVKAVHVPVIAAGGIADARASRRRWRWRRGVQSARPTCCVPEATTARPSGGASERRRASHRGDQSLHRPPGARHREPHHPGAGADEPDGPAVPASDGHHTSSSSGSGEAGPR